MMNKKGNKPLQLDVSLNEEKKPVEYGNVVGQDSLTRFDVKNKNTSSQNRSQRPARPKNPANSTPKTLKKRNDKGNQ